MGQVVGCVRVKQSNVGIKEVFDKYDDVLQPGCHFVPWCFGHQVAATLYLGFKHFNVPVQAKTKDNVFVTVVVCIQYRVLEEMVVEAHYKIDNHATHMSRYVTNVIKGLVPNMDLDSVFEKKNEIEAAVQKELGKAMSAFGFEILKTFILDIKLEEPVKKAMSDAVKLRVETKEKAEAEKILQLKKAESVAESKYLVGLGMARQFQAIADGVSESKLAFPENVPDATAATSSKDIMDMVLVNQYFDTIKEITTSSKTNAVYISNGNIAVSQVKDATVAVKDIASQVKDDLVLVQGNAAAAAKGVVSQVKNAPVQGNAAAKGAPSLVRNYPLQIQTKGKTPNA